MPNDQPIGIFDSGFGGLTVARAIIDLLPSEDVIYFGDTARYPYGPQPLDKIKAYSNICPHFGGPIGHHKIKKNVDGNPVFTCLWHNLEFDIYKGKCFQSEKLKLREYDLSIEGDDIFVFLN